MNRFESELKKGNFFVGECTKCKKIAWPPSDSCNRCFVDLAWRKIREPGILIEYSSKDGKLFGIVEFEEHVRVMGSLSNSKHLEPGQKIRILGCSFDEAPRFQFEAE
ncbi:MAG TPA: hypothetical protein VFM64_00420 [Candidatus Nitrosotenuis sp.]|nr:hypothetical protein [Candidatus Nitrosotenuis sp.]